MIVRYCSRCDTEFQPHIVRCSDCGGDLEDRDPDAVPAETTGAAPQEEAVGGEFVTIASGLTVLKAEVAARQLGAAGIPFHVGARGYDFTVEVKKEDQAAARQVLVRARAIPRPASADEPAVAETGGPCPACGDPVAAGSQECASCGLSLGSDAAVCDKCGSELDPPWAPCPRCSPE
jgi:hypothetical protein